MDNLMEPVMTFHVSADAQASGDGTAATPYPERSPGMYWMNWGQWASPPDNAFCSWVSLRQAPPPPFVAAYRRCFQRDKPATVKLHVTADERYELYLDGRRIGRGPERGDAHNWYFESYPVELAAGKHVLVAQVWSAGRESAGREEA